MLSSNKYLNACSLVIAFLLFFKNIASQNLIQNGSFENISNIDCYGGFYNGTFPNSHVLDDWYQYNSPDFFSPLCGPGGFSIPNNYYGFSYPKLGSTYVGFIGYAGIGNEGKEYLYQQLASPLVFGRTYCLSFYISLADISNGAIKNIGAYFSSSLPSLVSFSYINAVPQIENQSGFMTDTLNWLNIQGCFTAQGGEQFLIIGNFNSNANTDTVKVNTTSTATAANPRYSYYYIDDILLYDQSTVDINEHDNSITISIYPNPTEDSMNISLSVIKENTRIDVFNNLGEIVLSENLHSQNSAFNTSNMQCGVYHYHIFAGGATIKQGKIILVD